MTFGNNLDGGDLIQITPPTTPSNSFVPSTTLFCMIQTMDTVYKLRSPYYSYNCLYSSFIYQFTIPKVGTGGIVSTYSQLITIKTYTNTGVNIPQINARYETLLQVQHPTGTTTQTDIVYLQPPSVQLSYLQINHMSLTPSQYNFIQVVFTLNSALISEWVSTLSSPSVEMIIYLEFDRTYYNIALGVTSSGSLQYTYSNSLSSGDQCDINIQSVSGGTTTTISSTANFLMGDTLTNPKIAIPIHDALSASPTTYYITIPMILNPTTVNQPLNINLWAVKYYTSQAFPTILLYYSLRNHIFTVTSTVTTGTISLTTTGLAIQTTSQPLTFQFTSPSSVSLASASTDCWAVRILDGYLASSFSSGTISNCNLIYFSIMNMYLLQPKSSYSLTTQSTLIISGLSILNYVSTYSIESIIFHSQSTYIIGTQTSSMATSVLSPQPGSFTKIEGLTNLNSEGLYSMTFTYHPLTIPSLGYMEITIPSVFSPISNLGLGDYCTVISPTNEATNSDGTNNVIYCYQVSSTLYRILGFGAQGSPISLSMNLYLKVAASGTLTLTCLWIYGISGNSASQIISVTSFAGNPGTASTTSHLTSLAISNSFPLIIYADLWGPLQFNFKTTTGSPQYANSAQLVLTLPTGFTLASGGSTKVYALYGPSSGSSYVTLIPTVSGQIITIPIQSGYDIPMDVDYTLIINTVLGTSNNGIQRPDPYLYTFILEWMDSSTLKEIGRYDYKVIPAYSTTGTIVVINKGNMQATIMEIKIIPDRNIASSNFEVQTNFITNDGFNNVFLDDVGSSMTASQTAKAISCSEPLSTTVISNSRISCVLWKGSSTTYTPALLRTPISNAITSGTNVNYYIASLSNPSLGNYLTGLEVKITQNCRSDGLMCVYYDTFVTYTTLNALAWTYNYDLIFNPSRSATLSNTLIYTTGVTQAFPVKFTATINSGDFLIFIYPQYNMVMCDTCTSTFGTCMTFPLCNWVLLTLSSGITASTLTSRSIVITNARYVDAIGTPVYIQAWSGSTSLLLDAEQYNHPGYSPFTSTVARPITLAITPTRTTPLNYWLQNFMNYATLTANGIYYNSEITWFKLVASYGVSYFDTSSCNASLTLASPLRNDPYPARFLCTIASSNVIYITQNPYYPIPAYENPAFETWQLSIDFFFWISSASSITFTLYGCAIATTNTYISQGSLTFSVDPYPQPEFSDLTFNTNSFYDRIGVPGGKVEFYMLLRPSTSATNYVINKLVYTIPNDFGYPAVATIDCIMEGATTYAVSSCVLQRIGGRTLVTLIPSVYNNEVKIVRLTYNAGNVGLYTVPLIGGNNYVLQVDMYSGNNQLVERGTANISQIYPGSLIKLKIYLI